MGCSCSFKLNLVARNQNARDQGRGMRGLVLLTPGEVDCLKGRSLRPSALGHAITGCRR